MNYIHIRPCATCLSLLSDSGSFGVPMICSSGVELSILNVFPSADNYPPHRRASTCNIDGEAEGLAYGVGTGVCALDALLTESS